MVNFDFLDWVINVVCASEWKPPSGRNISTVASNQEQIVVAIGRDVHYLEIGNGVFTSVGLVLCV